MQNSALSEITLKPIPKTTKKNRAKATLESVFSDELGAVNTSRINGFR